MEDKLVEAGLSRNEAKVYLALSETGMASAYKVAKESNVFKANAYDSLKKLVDKGLVSKKHVDGKTVYEAGDPSFIIDMIDSKKEKISEIIPSLRLIQRSAKTESVVNIYKGVDSFLRILYHLLDYNDPILVYGAPKNAYDLMKHRIGHFHNERIRRGIKQIHIYNLEAMERIKQIKSMPLTPIKCLPELFDSHVATNICGDEVVLVVWKPPIKVIQIKDKDMAEAYKKYFKILWKNAKKVV